MGLIWVFKVKFTLAHLGLEAQDQSPPKTIGIFTKLICIFFPHLVVLPRTGDELSYRQV